MAERFACPCCGFKTFDEKPGGTYDICEVCFWEDDMLQFDNPDYEGGVNPISLRQAQKNFMEFGAIDQSMLYFVRDPEEEEMRDEDWKPLD
jgi:hypothetical protein